MKTIGLLGGMSWESSIEYYRLINEGVRERLGGLHSAQCLMYSFDFDAIERLQMAGDWDGAAQALSQAARSLVAGGAECLVICTNTMHKVADAVEAAIDVPLLHIADATASTIQQAGLERVALLGTRFTMEEAFYKGRLVDKFGLDVRVPGADERQIVHNIIYEELVRGQIEPASREQYQAIIQRLYEGGAQGVILGCTEIGLLIQQQHSPIPVFDTTRLHAAAAVEWALKGQTV